MRRIIVLVAAAVVLVLAGCSSAAPAGNTTGGPTGSSGSGASKTASVEIKEFSFQPASVEVAVDGAVTWTNADPATHTVKGEGWGSADLAQGATYSNTFDKAGSYAYSCGVHPSMKGEVVVK